MSQDENLYTDKLIDKHTDELNNHVESYEESNEFESLPLDVHIGFYGNVSLKDVKKHVLSYAQKNFTTLNDVYYQVVKYEDGFLFEIHQNGHQRGYIDDYLSRGSDDGIIVTNRNVYRVSGSVHGGLRLVRLTDEDVRHIYENPNSFNLLQGKGKLLKLKKDGYGFYLFSILFCSLAFAGLGMSAAVKYLVIDKTTSVFFSNANKTYPNQFIRNIETEFGAINSSIEYFKSFNYDRSKTKGQPWEVMKESILPKYDDMTNKLQDSSVSGVRGTSSQLSAPRQSQGQAELDLPRNSGVSASQSDVPQARVSRPPLPSNINIAQERGVVGNNGVDNNSKPIDKTNKGGM